jgi:hypothetical protein
MSAKTSRKSLRRVPPHLQPRTRFLVYVEGAVTEEIYLKGMKSDLGRKGPNIVIGTEHGEPLSLINAAIAHNEREMQQGDSFDQVWCVFDIEAPVPTHPLTKHLPLRGGREFAVPLRGLVSSCGLLSILSGLTGGPRRSRLVSTWQLRPAGTARYQAF